MIGLPRIYDYLNDEPYPRILVNAIKLHGTLEVPGSENSPVIVGWAAEIGKPVYLNYQHDSTPWCGLFMAVCAKRSGLDLPPAPLWALSWALWGTKADVPNLGDVLTFKRAGGGGHVALYVGEDKTHFHILGGNQRDSVCIVRKPKTDLYAARRTKWKVAEPPNIRRVFLSEKGIMAGSET